MKRLLIALAVVLPAISLLAEHNHLVVHLKDGSHDVYALADDPHISFSPTEATITTPSASTSYLLDDFDRFLTIEQAEETSIDAVSTATLCVKLVAQDTYEISGHGVRGVLVFDLKGILLEKIDNADGTVTVNLTGRPDGIYLLTIEKAEGTQSVKLIKN